jgi:hypothetical protein
VSQCDPPGDTDGAVRACSAVYAGCFNMLVRVVGSFVMVTEIQRIRDTG